MKLFLYILIFLINIFINNGSAENSIYQLKADKIVYKDNLSLIIAEGNAIANDQYGREIKSQKIIYYKAKSIIETIGNSIYSDLIGNTILADQFFYDLNKKKILANKNVKYFDKHGNKFNFKNFEYFENSEKAFGEQMIGTLADKSSVEGNYVEIDNLKGSLIVKNKKNKNNFFNKLLALFKKNENRYTTCENKGKANTNINERCPDWSISTINTRHDSNKKMVYHEHAVIKLRNIPVFYTPYFSHPDPSVKRKSGFLTPSTKNFNNLGRTIKTPYFFEINDFNDFTFTPIIYQDENSIFLGEYNHQFTNGKFYLDGSYSKGYKEINKLDDDGNSLQRTSGSRNHIFANYTGNHDNIIFENNDLEINIQRISQKNYLNVNEINTVHVLQDTTSLNNNIILNSYEKNRKLTISGYIYEDITSDNKNTKYQYVLPSISYNDHFSFLSQNLNLSNTFEAKNTGGDSNQINQINEIYSESEQIIVDNIGLGNVIKFNLANTNIYNENISNNKENLNSDFIPTFAIQTVFPLFRFIDNTEEIITPKIFAKITPGETKTVTTSLNTLNYTDVFSMNRMKNFNNPEKGKSIGYGIEYKNDKKNEFNQKYITSKFTIGQVLNEKNSDKIPSNTSLNKKKSNFVGDFNFNFNKDLYSNESEDVSILKSSFKLNNSASGVNINYSYNLNNNLNKILKNTLDIGYDDKKNSIRVSYNELHNIGDSQTISSTYKKYFENGINIGLGITKDLQNKFTESNFIESVYESDCLKIGLSLVKKFYSNQDIKPENNLNLFVMLKPFGQPFSPDLNSLINEK